MSNDNVWMDRRDARDIRIAIPDHPVQKFKMLTGVKMPDHEIRSTFRFEFNKNYIDNETLSIRWGHVGFAVPLDYYDEHKDAQLTFWMVFNEDKKGTDDYVLVTVYTSEQFEKRMRGDYFSATSVGRKVEHADSPMMLFLVRCRGEQEREFDDENQCLRYLEELAKKGRTAEDWQVYKKVKTTVTITD